MTALIAVTAAFALAGCGDDDESDTAGTATEPTTTTDVVGSDDELPADLVAEVESICGRLVTEIGSLPSPVVGGPSPQEYARRVDDLQRAALAELRELSDQVTEAQLPAWDAYLAAQQTAFQLSPPPSVGEPQPELDAASAAAEAQAAELGFASCSSV